MKIKLFVAREIQYFELGIFSFNSYVYYLTRGFIASTRAFNLPTRAFNLATRAFSLLTRAFELVTCEFELVTRDFELVTREFELVTRGFELVTRVLLFHSERVQNLLLASWAPKTQANDNSYIRKWLKYCFTKGVSDPLYSFRQCHFCPTCSMRKKESMGQLQLHTLPF